MIALEQPEYPLRGCELCNSTAARELYTARDRLGNSDEAFQIVECLNCGALRTLPEMTEAELAPFYTEDYWGEEEPTQEWVERSQSEKTDFFHKCESDSGRILDVGCGSGFFLRALDAKKWDRYGVEISREAARLAARSLGTDHVFSGTMLEAQFEKSFFDAISFWSSLEHTNEPRASLIRAREIIKPGGTLIIQVPNAASYQSRIFKGDWFALDVPRHRYHFSYERLAQLLAETGFDIYLTTFQSKSHNSHALRQSLKSRLRGKGSGIFGQAAFLFSIPFIKPFDYFMSRQGKGATITLAARAI
jgi:2-polyprenyl-3-methyl-5-hydroxy-6-metoxy-1,4-benzoquinol methylase